MLQPSKSKSIAVTMGILAGLLLNGVASAHTLSPGQYGAKLDRCVQAVRIQLGADAVTRVRHVVTAIDRRHAWYVFSIHSEVVESGTDAKQAVISRCKAHRWDDETVIEAAKI